MCDNEPWGLVWSWSSLCCSHLQTDNHHLPEHSRWSSHPPRETPGYLDRPRPVQQPACFLFTTATWPEPRKRPPPRPHSCMASVQTRRHRAQNSQSNKLTACKSFSCAARQERGGGAGLLFFFTICNQSPETVALR